MIGAAGSSFLFGVAAILTSIDGRPAQIDPAKAKATVVIFTSTVCPVAADYYPRISALWTEYGRRPNVSFLVVYPNKTESLADIRLHAAEMKFPFPVYRDEGNRLADELGARVTPTAIIRRAGGEVVFRGPIDDAANPARVKHHYLRDAIRRTLAGHKGPAVQPAGDPYG